MKWIQYNEKLRKSIHTGDLYFTQSDALIPTLIRFFTRSKVSHVGIFVWLGGRLFVVETTAFYGCRMLLASQRLHEKFLLVKTHEKVTPKFVNSLLKDVYRVKYNYLGVALALFVSTHFTRKFCSEWVASKLHLNFKTMSRGIEPQDIYETFTK